MVEKSEKGLKTAALQALLKLLAVISLNAPGRRGKKEERVLPPLCPTPRKGQFWAEAAWCPRRSLKASLHCPLPTDKEEGALSTASGPPTKGL